MRHIESREDYLEKILQLSREKSFVRSVDVAKAMHFSKPSISVTMKKLKAEGLIEQDEHGYILLTKTGLDIANKTLEKHLLIAKLFVRLGVSEKTAFEDAGHLEHDLSDETWSVIKKHVAR